MADLYSIAMFEEHDLDGIGASVGPPTGFVWVLRCLDVVNGAALNNVMLKGSAGQVIWVHQFATPLGFDYASWRGRQVIEPGGICWLETTAPADVTLSGYQLRSP